MREPDWVITTAFYFIKLLLYASKEHPVMLNVLMRRSKVMWIVLLALRRLKG